MDDFAAQSRLDSIHDRALTAARDDEKSGTGSTDVNDILKRAAAYVAFLKDGPAPPETKCGPRDPLDHHQV